MERARRGDEDALPGLRAVLDVLPDILPKFDIAGEAWEAILRPLFGEDVAVRELLLRRMREVAAELAGPRPTPIERLLAERAALCWHVVHQYERTYAQAEGLSLKQAEYHQRRIDAAHRRFLSSLKSLATVRRLTVPAPQVNIGRTS